MRYPVIMADPPWTFEYWSLKGAEGRSPQRHYDCQSCAWIRSLDIASVCATDCSLFLWVTWPRLLDGLAVVESWGFEYKTLAFSWVKTVASRPDSARMGLGYWTRANTEPCLLATRGNPKRLDKGVEQVLACPPGAHSEKPLEAYERIERLVAGPYLELFARPQWGILGPRPGWTYLGNEVTGRDMADDLRHLAAAVECQPLLDVTAPEPAPRAEQIAMEVD